MAASLNFNKSNIYLVFNVNPVNNFCVSIKSIQQFMRYFAKRQTVSTPKVKVKVLKKIVGRCVALNLCGANDSVLPLHQILAQYL